MTDETRMSLWCPLHDAVLRGVDSDASNGTASLSVEHTALNEFYGHRPGALFHLRFIGVESLAVLVARCRAFNRLAGGESCRRRIESASWTAFEQSFNGSGSSEGTQFETGRYEILQSHLIVGEILEFVIDEIADYAGFTATHDDLLCEIRIEARGAQVDCPDGQIRTMEEFANFGAALWKTLDSDNELRSRIP